MIPSTASPTPTAPPPFSYFFSPLPKASASAHAPPPNLASPLPPASTGTLASINDSLPVPLTAATAIYLVAGASARMCGSILTCPLDTLKARVQFAQRSPEVKQYSSGLDAARSILRTEGPLAFYRGLPARLAYVGPAAAVSFFFYEEFRHLVHRPDPGAGGYATAAAALAAGGALRVLGTTLRTPFDVVRQRMQVMGGLKAYSDAAAAAAAAAASSAASTTTASPAVSGGIAAHTAPAPAPAPAAAAVSAAAAAPAAPTAAASGSGSSSVPRKAPRGVYRNTLHALLSVARSEGVRALFAGVGVTVLRDIPFAVTYFLAYEAARTAQQRLLGGCERDDRLSPPNHMIAGAFGAACGVVVSNPLDVAKTRLQTQGSLEHTRYRGVRDVMRTIIAEDGPRGLFRGLGPRLAYLCPSAAVTFALYELFKKGFASAAGVDPAAVDAAKELAKQKRKAAAAAAAAPGTVAAAVVAVEAAEAADEAVGEE